VEYLPLIKRLLKKTVQKNKSHQQESGMTMLQLFDMLSGRRTTDDNASSEKPQVSDEEAVDRVAQAAELRNKANNNFKESKYGHAVSDYEDAILLLQFTGGTQETKTEQQKSNNICLLNKSACNLKLGDYDQVIVDCSLVLETEPNSVKALFRRGHAHLNKREFDEAKIDLDAAYALHPEDPTISNLIQELKKQLKIHSEEEKKLWGRMFEKK